MGVSIEVYRGAGENRGDDIVEPLLGDSVVAALARGRAEMDDSARPRSSVTLTTPFLPHARSGLLVEVPDPLSGTTWRGRIVGVQHKIDPPTRITELRVERPRDE